MSQNLLHTCEFKAVRFIKPILRYPPPPQPKKIAADCYKFTRKPAVIDIPGIGYSANDV
jgi:hypothetical protein